MVVGLLFAIKCHGSDEFEHIKKECQDGDAGECISVDMNPDMNVPEGEMTNDADEDEYVAFDEMCNEHGELCEVDQIFDFYDCGEVLSSTRPVHNESTWMLLRGTYIATVGVESSTITFPPSYHSGFRVPFYVDQHPEAGRGVFASEPIKRGQLIWTSLAQSARFKTGGEYRHFLSSLPGDLVCDLIIWCYPMYEDLKDHDSARIACDLDEGSFINHSYIKSEYNFGCDKKAAKNHEGGCTFNFFAKRDIKAGEEIRANYNEFAHGGKWDLFGL